MAILTIPYDEYDALPGIRWSVLKECRVSPLHFRYRELEEREDSDTLTKGRAAHMAVFEPELFESECVIWEGKARRGKEWDEFKAGHYGQTILLPRDYTDCEALRDIVREHPLAGPLVRAAGTSELSVTWTDADTGLACKARLDRVSGSHLELKTTTNLDRRLFGSLAGRMGYHGQVAMQHDGLLAHDVDLPATVIVVESTAPYDVMVWEPSGEELWVGELLYKELLAKVKACRESGCWPGRYQTPQSDILPPWEFPDDSESEHEIMGLVPVKEVA